jgi:hypothetical protein
MCGTVNGDGKVTDVKILTGPPELRQSSVDAVKQWQFRPPTNAPATTQVEISNDLSDCPGGGRGMDTGKVTVNIEPDPTIDDPTGKALKMVANLYRPFASISSKGQG